MSPEKISLRIDHEMEKYIRLKTTDLRIATTCEGPLIFSVRISPSKPTDLVMEVGKRKIYISAIQAPFLKILDSKMLTRCALEKRRY